MRIPMELALNAYVFLGNSLSMVVNRRQDGAERDLERDLRVSRAELVKLWAALERLTPPAMLAGIEALPPEQRDVLARCGRWWMTRLGPEFSGRIGLDEEDAQAVLDWLGGLGG